MEGLEVPAVMWKAKRSYESGIAPEGRSLSLEPSGL
jgi:hypothetical protein